jgi:hypothetical protein
MQYETKTPSKQAPRNPRTRAAHRREVFWQIAIPFTIGVIIIIGLAVGLGLLGVGSTSRWSDISMIWLLLPLLVLALIPIALLMGMIYGLMRVLQALPVYAFQAQNAVAQLAAGVRRVADQSVEPFLRVKSGLASLKALRRPRG